MFFGRTDHWRSLARAKFDEEADFEVCLAMASQKRHQISEKQYFKISIRNFRQQFFLASTDSF